MQDGNRDVFVAGDAFHIPPNHDAFVEGDEEVRCVDADQKLLQQLCLLNFDRRPREAAASTRLLVLMVATHADFTGGVHRVRPPHHQRLMKEQCSSHLGWKVCP